jgi:hypothetical protein
MYLENPMFKTPQARNAFHFAHAVQCGVPMTDRRCVDSTTIGRGAFPAVDIIDPVTLDPVWVAGLWITQPELEKLEKEWGIDYIIVDA